jgi:hypothetical protein
MNLPCALFVALALPSPTTPLAAPPGLDAETRARVVERTLELLREKYVFEDVAEEMACAVRARVEAGEYDRITSESGLAGTLTQDLQAVSRDLHLRVMFDRERTVPDAGEEPTPEESARMRARARARNFGFEKVERLPGNVGYLDLRGFMELEWAKETAAGAMGFLAHTDALIVDLRQNGGGSPETVAFLSSYLFGDEPVHLNSLYWREGDRTEEYWTDPLVPVTRTPSKPVYVLTSNGTFSAAEEFTYNLKCLGRATVVGRRTGGGAHPGGTLPIGDGFAVWVPMGRAVNPITGTNWEGEGVEPDVDVPVEVALSMAHMMAVELLIGTEEDPERAEQLRGTLDGIRREIDELAGAGG